MVRLAGRWAKRRWHGEVPTDAVPEPIDDSDASSGIDVRDALTLLPWHHRAVLVLRYFDDLTEVETAAVLGCSTGTVKSRASRALAALRAAGLNDVTTEAHDG
jgi:RNA polymerase sigma factor (sigma-70 family)